MNSNKEEVEIVEENEEIEAKKREKKKKGSVIALAVLGLVGAVATGIVVCHGKKNRKASKVLASSVSSSCDSPADKIETGKKTLEKINDSTNELLNWKKHFKHVDDSEKYSTKYWKEKFSDYPSSRKANKTMCDIGILGRDSYGSLYVTEQGKGVVKIKDRKDDGYPFVAYPIEIAKIILESVKGANE